MKKVQFDVFIERAVKEFSRDYIDIPEEIMKQHKFSEEFERKMQKLIRKQKSFYFTLTRSIILLVVLLLFLLWQ